MRRFPGLINAIAVTVSFLLALSVVGLLCLAVIPELIESIVSLLQSLPDTIQSVITKVQAFAETHPQWQGFINEAIKRAEIFTQQETTIWIAQAIDVLTSSAIGVADVLTTVFIGVIAAVYMLADKHRLKRSTTKIVDCVFTKENASFIKEEARFADKTFSRYMIGTLFDACLVGVITYIFALIAKLPSPMLIAVTIAMTNIIPIVGPFIGAIPTALIVLAYAPDKFIAYCVFLLVLQQLDGHVLVPKVLGQAVGISSFTALIAIVVGGGLFGIPGMILGVPFVTVALDVIKKIAEKNEETELNNETELDISSDEIN